MKHTNCRLGNMTGADGDGGWSFMVIGYGNETLFWMTYDTEARAKAAHELLTAAFEGAGVVFSPPVK
jgi:hypothetical protein